RVPPEPFPRGSRPARRRQLAGLGGRRRGRQRTVVQQDASADALLLGDLAAAQAVAPRGGPHGRWCLEDQRVRTMKSVYSPVSSDNLLSDTINDEPGVIISAIRSTSSGGMIMRSSATLGLGFAIGATTSTAFTACSRRPLRPLLA